MATLIITFNWWTTEDSATPKEEHREALDETATERIFAMMKEGYTAGELRDTIRMTDDDPEDGIEYSGWWEATIDYTDTK